MKLLGEWCPTARARPLGGLVLVIGRACCLGGLECRGLAHGHVPPRLRVGCVLQRVGLDVDHGARRGGLGVADRRRQLVRRRRSHDVHAEARGVGGQVDRQRFTVEASALGPVAVARAEPLRAQRLRERADRGEAVVLDEHHDDLDPLLDGGHQLGRHHQVGAVADHHEHVAVRARHPYAESAGDLVAHAGVAVLDVVAHRVAHLPELVQVAGHRAGRADHHVPRVGEVVDETEHLALREPAVLGHRGRVVGLVDGGEPGGLQRGVLVDVLLRHLVVGERLGQGLQGLPGVRDHAGAGVLDGVDRCHVDVHEAHVRVLERGAAGRGEVGVARADPDHHVGVVGDGVGGRRARRPEGTEALRVVERERPLAGLALAHGDAGGRAEGGQCVVGAGVADPATGDDERTPGGADQLDGLLERSGLGQGARDVPDASCEQARRPVVRLRLHVLREADGDRSGLRRVGQHAHRGDQGRRKLLGTPDPVEVLRDGAEDVVDGDVTGVRQLELLQQGRRAPVGERVRGQQQDRDPVDRGQGSAGDHVGGAGTDAGGDGPGLQAVAHPRVGDGRVHHRLLVAAQHVGQCLRLLELGLQERLPEAGDVAVAEDPEAAGEQLLLDAVALGVLHRQEPHGRLGDRQPHRLARTWPGVHRLPSSRGSVGWSVHVSRTHVCSGWSLISQARSSAGPAITFR